MTLENVREIFGDTIQLSKYCFICAEDFWEIFKSVNDPYSYDEYTAIDNGEKGYKEFLDRCKEEGLLR
ncbi:hypothetical protein CathTA2_0708 [Caldalkalibacillus thermarum TA2.A1]|uniref:Uncharacterized protein n=1 Tax=Caldalkalibacillus thermarum (strain TA2.A1) TaxID=986075 RepID=F5L4J5_CALTT|nr:hypothetical protein [Caldalkalibacillus thermarum]EGL83741.1 hypothetical protein CathTA2_0708 [Caldalkalibacillus thermarum TA2.A1]QZT33980.1 hypothetical protein HUR95_00630 [Caldalkalibacillus thermarum TA2.A1]